MHKDQTIVDCGVGSVIEITVECLDIKQTEFY